MPYDFAARLFDATKLGMRVIVAPGDAEPVEVIHPALFQPKSGADVVAAARAAEAEEAARKADQARLAAVAAVREAAVAAENARVAAAEAARKAARDLEPMSVFISRKTQRLYVRQGFQPILESPVTIQDADRPIGTHVFTAMERAGGNVDMRWSVVSLDGGHADDGVVEPNGPARGHRSQEGEPTATDPGGAKAALDRIAIPQEALDRIAGIASPRSSLIISDEALSSETGKDTEFVVLMSGEPQGGIKFRRRVPETNVRYERPRDRLPSWPSPFAGPFPT